MEYNKLAHSDLKVSKICLGTMNWGDQNSFEEGFAQMDYALECGVNFFDTAELYPVPPKAETYSKTESCIGQWFKQSGKRKDVILASKIAGPGSHLHWIRNGESVFDEKNITEALEASLNRLQTDYIDLYQLHWPNRKTNFFGQLGYKHKPDPNEILIEESLKALQKCIQSGKIRYYGLSNETPWGFMNCLRKADELGMQRPISLQNPYSLLNRTYEIGNAEISLREHIGLLAYSPLGFGVLSGKYLKGQKPKGSRLDINSGHFKRYSSSESTSATNKYVQLASRYNLDPAQMALAYVNSRPFVSSNIIGASNMEQLKTNIESINITLNEEIIEGIEKVHTQIPNPAP